jgi:hypothetical protein
LQRDIRAGAASVHLRAVGELQASAALDHRVAIAGRDQHRAGNELVAVACLADRERTERVEAVGERGGELRRHVLHDQHPLGERPGQARDDALERGRASGGDRDDHRGVETAARTLRGLRRRGAEVLTARGRSVDRAQRPGDALLRGQTSEAGRGRGPRRWGVGRRRRDRTRRGRADDLADQLLAHRREIGGDLAVGLGDEIDRARCQRLERLLGAGHGVRREHHHGDAVLPDDRAHRLGAVHLRHVVVHRDHVGLERRRLAHRVDAVARLTDHVDPRIPRERAGHGGAHERAVVDDEDPDALRQGFETITPAGVDAKLSSRDRRTGGSSWCTTRR